MACIFRSSRVIFLLVPSPSFLVVDVAGSGVSFLEDCADSSPTNDELSSERLHEDLRGVFLPPEPRVLGIGDLSAAGTLVGVLWSVDFAECCVESIASDVFGSSSSCREVGRVRCGDIGTNNCCNAGDCCKIAGRCCAA